MKTFLPQHGHFSVGKSFTEIRSPHDHIFDQLSYFHHAFNGIHFSLIGSDVYHEDIQEIPPAERI